MKYHHTVNKFHNFFIKYYAQTSMNLHVFYMCALYYSPPGILGKYSQCC